MPTDTKLKELIINELTEEQYNALTPNENELYLTPDNSTPDTKTISIFGNHSILVPKDSTDTNIDLYKHHINFTINELNGFFEFYSSKNLVCDSLTDLKTLLGNTFEIQAFGYSGTIETYTTEIIVQAVSESKLFISVGGQLKIQDIEEATFTDTVTTI